MNNQLNDNSNETFYKSACKYLNQGISVIPLTPGGKKPYYELLPTNAKGKAEWKEYSRRLPTIEEIRRWDELSHGKANLGTVQGQVSQRFGLDVDFRNGGDKTLKQLCGDSEIITATVKSGDGLHLQFEHPGYWFRLREELPGIDLISEGRYLVAPPSLHPTGVHYQFLLDIEPAPPPAWLWELMIREYLPSAREVDDDIAVDDALDVFYRCRKKVYPSDVKFDYAVIVTLVNRGCSLPVILEAFKTFSQTETDSHFQIWVKKYGMHHAEKKVSEMYKRALRQPDSVEYQQAGVVASRARSIVMSRAWPGASGRSDQAVLLAHITKYEDARIRPWSISVRGLAELSRMGIQTVSRANARLAHDGWLLRPDAALRAQHKKRASEGKATPSGVPVKWRANSLADSYDFGSNLESLLGTLSEDEKVSDLEHLQSLKTACTCSNGLTYVDRDHTPGQTKTHGVFETRGGFGRLAEAIWLSVRDTALTAQQIQEKTGGHIQTVRAKLKLLSEHSILFKIGQLYRANPDFDFAALASARGTSTRDLRRKRMHAEHRESHRQWCEGYALRVAECRAQRAAQKGEVAS
jgi:hypothetical protein